MRVRAFKRRISVSKQTSAFVGENDRDRKRIYETKFTLRWLYSAERKKQHIIRTDDGGAVVAHHAHDERVCYECVCSIKAFVCCSLK